MQYNLYNSSVRYESEKYEKTFLKAEELKGKLSGLYEPETKQEININCMGNIKIGGKTLNLKVGKEPTKEEE